ncbi:amidase [Marinobacterium sp. AK62]|uniref:Amidase n=1 Tax=Marinobacterium alkalitolerans TaxID=1542925 RepID=A0ABS3ZB56_9GAMM|nr:amidase [Marinobacterium alkalitolerans]MBP0048937.1 amidase [Marinobacterium alkalitolerans]
MKNQKAWHEVGLREALNAIEKQECSAVDVINACFDRIEAREPVVGAWQYRLTREEYLSHYRQHQGFYEQSLLKGLPVGIKDIIDTADMPTEMGSPIHQGREPVNDASCVGLIRQAGGIVLGKTVTTEFAYFKPGKTANPRDLQRTPGGSSSGSAAAVADAMVPVALGSQTAASVIRPAAYCGAAGYVGTRGEFSLRGVQPLAQSLDSLGILARHAEDIDLMRAILLRNSRANGPEINARPTRIAICPGHLVGETDSAMEHAIERLEALLQAEGVETTRLDQAAGLSELVEHHQTIMAYEVARNLVEESAQLDQLSAPLLDLIDKGLQMERSEYLRALQCVDKARSDLWARHDKVDAVLAPAAPGVAPLGLGKTGAPHMSRPWQVMGLPVVTLPGLTDQQGLPLGIQLAGRMHEDQKLLDMARWLETLLTGA